MFVAPKNKSRQFSEAKKYEKMVATNLCHDTRHSCRDKNKTTASKLCRNIIKVCHDKIQENAQKTCRDRNYRLRHKLRDKD